MAHGDASYQEMNGAGNLRVGESDLSAEMKLSFFITSQPGLQPGKKGNRAMTQELFHIGGVFVLAGILLRLREIVVSFDSLGRRKSNGDCSDQ